RSADLLGDIVTLHIRLVPATRNIVNEPVVDGKVSSFGPTEIDKTPFEGSENGLRFRKISQHADPAHLVRLLRVCRERPSGRHTSKTGDEIASPHGHP